MAQVHIAKRLPNGGKGISPIGVSMGVFGVEIEVTEPAAGKSAMVFATVDTGAADTLIPESILNALGVMPIDSEFFMLADGRQVEYYVGEVRIRYGDIARISPVIFGPDGACPLLGATTLQILKLSVDAANERLVRFSGIL